MPVPLRIALLQIAKEVFLDQAERDYIAARSNFRLDLREQFLWSALQACEKYLKAILLFNDRSARYLPGSYDIKKKKRGKEFRNHDVKQLFQTITQIEDFATLLPTWIEGFLGYLTIYGNNRYLSVPTYATGSELDELDELVWYLRRLCRDFGAQVTFSDGSKRHVRDILVRALPLLEKCKRPALERPLAPEGAVLESVLKRHRNDATRMALTWNNRFFGARQRQRVDYGGRSSSQNPPHSRDWFQTPEITEAVAYFVKGLPSAEELRNWKRSGRVWRKDRAFGSP